MKEQLEAIDGLLNKGDIKRADIGIARLMRSGIGTQDRAQVLVRRARARLLSARAEDALDDIASAEVLNVSLTDDPAFVELTADCLFARFELASVGFADRNDTIQAEKTYRRIIATFPEFKNLGWSYYQLGRIHLTNSEIEQATTCFQQALLSPATSSSLTAYCYERLGFIAFYEERNLDKALAFLNRAIATYPASERRVWLVQVHILRCRVLRGLGDYDGALLAAEAALSVASTENKRYLLEALLTAGELSSELAGGERAVIQYLQQYIQQAKKPLGIDVTWSRVYEMLGNAYFAIGHYDQAIEAYQASLHHNPDHPWELSLWYRIARCYYQQRAYQEAINTLQRMIQSAQLDEQVIDDYRVYDMLGNALFALKRYDKAIEAYQMALRMAPANTDTIDTIRSYCDLAKELL
jgi:tetratricopeptide (TPR) repeat protein